MHFDMRSYFLTEFYKSDKMSLKVNVDKSTIIKEKWYEE